MLRVKPNIIARDILKADSENSKLPDRPSRGRGTGFARPQAQRPPRGAGRYTQ